jgi:Ni/Co efflux regulator RcnB
MKRLILTLASIATIATPLVATSANAQSRDRHDDRWERHHDDDRWDRQDRWDDRRDYREGRRHRHHSWDYNHHNGYYYNNQWSYGPPPRVYYDQGYYQPGYNAWRRGSVLPTYYRNNYVSDYGRYRLRAPPRGYAWYRAGDDYLLAAIATGLIYEIINGN